MLNVGFGEFFSHILCVVVKCQEADKTFHIQLTFCSPE